MISVSGSEAKAVECFMYAVSKITRQTHVTSTHGQTVASGKPVVPLGRTRIDYR